MEWLGVSIVDRKTDEVLLEIKGLYKKYDETTVLEDINLSIKKGEIVVVLGPSGCGKSTLLRCLNGLEKIQKGDIRFHNKSIVNNDVNWQEIRQRIGMVFQNYELFPHMTVIENIILGPIKVQKRKKSEVMEQARQLLDRVGLLDRQNSYPRQLSGGQKQRIAIVRALCMNPEIMLFDEVTASLDPEMVREVLDVILGLAKQGMTMVIVTHEMSFARAVADKIVFIDKGRICEISEPQEFFEKPKTGRAQQFLNIFQY
ncbi:amino acid ABC transporter ATP-binding protein [Acetivibrio clariflavus]|uniref:Amino acid ABC transporter ATP-binding protein, PAAT family n=1 Tax=Acetivibrio clariflavus (strain DSM 19732 / NBRC 101661 / EBR45) TaxID=720554 RepID=G8M0Y4_ACECE|nr:amino acid ABC transporter ATP-binding protein, PAAT family [Acetivibrio clariflavus DSM 19732]HPU42418.1 amino acid ABC transporter ATP-binding protein [Acetivibrio clariflavus]